MDFVEEVRTRFHFHELPRCVDGGVREEFVAFVFRKIGELVRIITARTNELIDERALQLAKGRFNGMRVS